MRPKFPFSARFNCNDPVRLETKTAWDVYHGNKMKLKRFMLLTTKALGVHLMGEQ
jgi:hypothetical protein